MAKNLFMLAALGVAGFFAWTWWGKSKGPPAIAVEPLQPLPEGVPESHRAVWNRIAAYAVEQGFHPMEAMEGWSELGLAHLSPEDAQKAFDQAIARKAMQRVQRQATVIRVGPEMPPEARATVARRSPGRRGPVAGWGRYGTYGHRASYGQ